ncbi:MAG: hypothetical protein LBT55_04555 [Clostridiaceae bacterium]|jgi:molecular chaperone GrpE (heat shock protein)|nr:hypothetical protein [Clostridiaceae bacterium]
MAKDNPQSSFEQYKDICFKVQEYKKGNNIEPNRVVAFNMIVKQMAEELKKSGESKLLSHLACVWGKATDNKNELHSLRAITVCEIDDAIDSILFSTEDALGIVTKTLDCLRGKNYQISKQESEVYFSREESRNLISGSNHAPKLFYSMINKIDALMSDRGYNKANFPKGDCDGVSHTNKFGEQTGVGRQQTEYNAQHFDHTQSIDDANKEVINIKSNPNEDTKITCTEADKYSKDKRNSADKYLESKCAEADKYLESKCAEASCIVSTAKKTAEEMLAQARINANKIDTVERLKSYPENKELIKSANEIKTQHTKDLQDVQVDIQSAYGKLTTIENGIKHEYVKNSYESLIEVYNLISDGYKAMLPVLQSSTDRDLKIMVNNQEAFLKIIKGHLARIGVEEISSKEGTLYDGRIHELYDRTKLYDSSINLQKAAIINSWRSGFKFNDKILQKEMVVI